MKQQKWDDSIEDSSELIEASIMLPDEDAEIEIKPVKAKSHLTDLRRRIEERLDSKRIDLEYDYDDLEQLPDSLQ